MKSTVVKVGWLGAQNSSSLLELLSVCSRALFFWGPLLGLLGFALETSKDPFLGFIET
jgi:hypothetical protein